MAVIGAAVDNETKQVFDAIARSRTLTASRLAGTLITDFIRAEQNGTLYIPASTQLPAVTSHPVNAGAKTEQVYVRLEPYYYDELGRLAAGRRCHRSSYLANLLYVHIDKRPVLCQDEVNALRQVARQLADVGRNVNQIAKKLNTSLEEAHVAAAYDFDLLRMLLDVETTAVKELVLANLRTWGVGDVH
ncbi:plasmid mobilization relaxosome protein MobC [Massilia orientalis]|uniref:Plasmid mobilization relaxosome protein MobC n=1 Tax=Massilia orientalis TaxID=3050128 RepID=A0ACC7MJC1_9BURK|nr:plasmid mobilization relaxosome protein MobC [Massilia sp. YIM B02787]